MKPLHFLLALFSCAFFAQASDRSIKIDSIDTESSSWPDFYKNYILVQKPAKFRNSVIGNQKLSSDYIYNHPGAAMTFRNLTKKNTASIRTIVGQREYFMQLKFRIPNFMRSDIMLPKCINCDQVIDRMDAPLWFWHFHKTQIKLHSENVHELWCVIKGSLRMTLIPKWTDGMIDHFLTEKSLSEAPNYKDTKFYRVDMEKDECFYVPANFLRQWEPSADTMGVIFQIGESILNERAESFDQCRSIGDNVTLEKIRFSDDDMEVEGLVKESAIVEKLISYLGPDGCLDSIKFEKIFSNDPELHSVTEDSAKNVFFGLDKDGDDQFCWSDLDLLTLESAIELSKLVNDNVKLENGKNDDNRKTEL